MGTVTAVADDDSMSERDLTVADLSETELLTRIFPLLPAGTSTLLGPGDDAAVLAAPDGRVVVSTDVLVEGRHFRRAWSSGVDVGRRAAAQNLSDVAAMGARPTGLVVVLVAPADLPVAWVLDLARGLAEACEPLGVGVVGGDLSGGDQLVVSVTVHGDLEGREPVRRAGARVGDVVAHAGHLGLSAAGLAVLGGDHSPTATGTHRSADPAGGPEDGMSALAVSTYRVPEPPLALGPEAARTGATAMLDVSDGLLRDGGRLALASGVVLDLRAGALAPAVRALAPLGSRLGVDPWAWVLSGGEDHGLLATFPPGRPLPAGFREVGLVREAGEDHPAGAVLLDGSAPPVHSSGWDHFRR